MFHHWRIVKTDSRKLWALQSMSFMRDEAGNLTSSPWQTVSHYPTRKQAITVGMIMRDRGEPISWHGGAVRMGIALVESC